MRKQALVVGLGQFGMAVAKSLAAMGFDVLAVDRREERIEEASRAGCETAAFDATHEPSLARAAPGRRDLCLCAVGDDARESAIIITALLRQMGAPRVVARATDPLTERILTLVGAHEVVHPERAFGERFAARVFHAQIVDELPLGADLVITELRPPPSVVGRSLAELALPRRFEVSVAAIRREHEGAGAIIAPAGEVRVQGDDILVLVGRHGAARRLIERLD
jgi:trk system potassium uptake protein TrkA